MGFEHFVCLLKLNYVSKLISIKIYLKFQFKNPPISVMSLEMTKNFKNAFYLCYQDFQIPISVYGML